jgi:hypothetical protein
MFSKYTGRRQKKSLKVLPYYHLLKCLKLLVAYAVSFEMFKGARACKFYTVQIVNSAFKVAPLTFSVARPTCDLIVDFTYT